MKGPDIYMCTQNFQILYFYSDMFSVYEVKSLGKLAEIYMALDNM